MPDAASGEVKPFTTPQKRQSALEYLKRETDSSRADENDALQDWYFEGWWLLALMDVRQVHTPDFWHARTQ